MKHPIKLLTPCLVALLVSSGLPFWPTAAQSDNKETPQEKARLRQELERKTLSMLEEAAAAAPSLKLPENRTFILASAADLFWEHDEKRARTLFWDAINAVNVLKLAKPSTTQQKNGVYFEIYSLRSQIITVAARRNPQLALELLHASRQTLPEPVDGNWVVPERELEQQIATAIAATDPHKALQLARDSLAKGLSLELINLLWNINQKDTELGTKFAAELVDKLKTSAVTDLSSYIAVVLVRTSREYRENPAELTAAGAARNLALSKEQRRTLTEIMADAASSASSNPNVLSFITEIMPEIEEFAPERALLLKRKTAEFHRGSPQIAQNQQLNSLVRSRDAEELLRASMKGNSNQRAWLEREAIMAAVTSRKADSFREFINKEINDGPRRKTVLDQLDSQEIEWAVHRGESETLRKLLPKVRLREQQARVMTELAMVLHEQGKRDEALTLLDEAQSLIKIDLQDETKSNALLALMLAYALIEPSRAFVIAERTIDRTNDDVAKLLLVDKLLKTGFLKRGEIIMNHSGLNLDAGVLKYRKGVVALARADFSRTRAAAERFERHELRIMAKLMLAQAILGTLETLNFRANQ